MKEAHREIAILALYSLSLLEPPDYDVELLDMATNNNTPTSKHYDPASSTYPINIKSELITSSEENNTETTTLGYPYSDTDMQVESSDVTAQVTQTPWELIQESAPKSEKQIAAPLVQPQTVRFLQPQQKPSVQVPQPLLPPPLNIRDNQVRVVIHNITQLTEEDVERSNIDGAGDSGMYDTSSSPSGIYDGDINDKT